MQKYILCFIFLYCKNITIEYFLCKLYLNLESSSLCNIVLYESGKILS